MKERLIHRSPWPVPFPPVFVHARWSGKPGSMSLKRRAGYQAAKKLGDFKAGTNIVEFLLAEDCIYAISDILESPSKTYVVAPARTFIEPRNTLPHILALIIANELGLRVCTSIYQQDGPKRDMNGFWERFATPLRFAGNIFTGADYILCDDVFSTGGTLAALRSFIESQGGRVICMTALASPGGVTAPIAVDQQTVLLLNSRHGLGLRPYMETEIGYGPECLTTPEARALLGQRSLVSIRSAVAEARYNRNVEIR